MRFLMIVLLVLFIKFIGILPSLVAFSINGFHIFGEVLALSGLADNNTLIIWIMIILLVLLILMMYKGFFNNRIEKYKITYSLKVLVPWILFTFFLLLRSVIAQRDFSLDNEGHYKLTLFLVRTMVPIVLIIIWYLITGKRNYSKFEVAFFILGLIQAVLVISSALMNMNISRVTVLSQNPITTARQIGIGLLAADSLFKNYYLKFPLALILFLGMFFTGSRGPLVSLLAIFFVYLLINGLHVIKYCYHNKDSIVRKLLPSASILLLVFFLLFYSLFLSTFLARGSQSFFSHSTVIIRTNLYRAALTSFSRSPLVGIGLGNYRFNHYTYPHNMLLEILAEVGLIGIFLFIIALKPMRTIAYGFHNIFFVYVFFTFLTSFFSGNMPDNTYLILPMVVLTMFYWKDLREGLIEF